MAPSVSLSTVRRILEPRLSAALDEVERLFETELSSRVAAEIEKRSSEAGRQAQRILTDQLNQAARRIRLAPDAARVAGALMDAAAALTPITALLRVSGSIAHGEQIRGIPPEHAEGFRKLEIALASAPALAQAVNTQEPVMALAEASQIGTPLAAIRFHSPQERVVIYPLFTRTRVLALLCAWNNLDNSALELLAQLAAGAWDALPAPAHFVTIAAQPALLPKWQSLPFEEQRTHLRAQRFARVEVARMRWNESERVQAGRARRDLYSTLREPIDATRELFHKNFFVCPSMVDYLHLELVRTLTNDDPDLLGRDYPGPLV